MLPSEIRFVNAPNRWTRSRKHLRQPSTVYVAHAKHYRRPIYHHILELTASFVHFRLRTVLNCRLSTAGFKSTVYIRIQIVSLLESLTPTHMSGFTLTLNFKYSASYEFIPFLWLVAQNSLNIFCSFLGQA